jgi:hypothetical protein
MFEQRTLKKWNFLLTVFSCGKNENKEGIFVQNEGKNIP